MQTIVIILAAALAAVTVLYIFCRKENSRLTALSASNAEQLRQLQAEAQAAQLEAARLSASAGSSETECSRLRDELAATRSQAAQSASEAKEAHAENARAQERLGLLSKEMARLNSEAEERFRALANEVLLQNSKALTERSRSGLAEVLEPMKENLEQFKATFIERYDREARDRFSLSDRIRELVELNHSIGLETRKLTNALKGNAKVQGDWGEMILDNILERSGFRRGLDYQVQETVATDEGSRLRPDVVINYTEGRKIIIDSKVSIQSYLGMLDATDDDRRQTLAKAHVASVKKHITELRNKSYQDFVGSDRVDFVLMFIPHEGAYLAAMNLDDSLWQTAFDSHVLIISPTHLMSVVRLVEQMWRHDKQNRNAIEIARQAGLMLDKFRGFIDDMERLDRSITGARDAWNGAFNKLSSGTGNLVSRAERLRTLGAKASKELPERWKTETGDDATNIATGSDEMQHTAT